MENLSRSYSKRRYHGNGFSTKTSKSPYDDVFRGPPKLSAHSLSPRLEDYTEIFGGFHSSRTHSIPILDLPPADGEDELTPLDVRSAQLDYTQIFGRFNVAEFALSFEDLVEQSNAGYNSSEGTWSPGQSESLSDDSDPSAFSERSEASPYVKQFNISSASDGMSHLTQSQTNPYQLSSPARPPPNIPNPQLKPSKIHLDQPEGGKCISLAGRFSESEQEEGYSVGTQKSVEWREAMGFIEVTDIFPPQDSPEKFKYDKQQKGPHELGGEGGGSYKGNPYPFELDLDLGISHRQGAFSELNNNGCRYDVDLRESELNMNKSRGKQNHGFVKFDNEKNIAGEEQKTDTEKEKYQGRYNDFGDKTEKGNVTNNVIVVEKRDDQQEVDIGGKGKVGEQEAPLAMNTIRSIIEECLWEEDAEKRTKWGSTMNKKNLMMGIEHEELKECKEVACNREDHERNSIGFKWKHGIKQFPTASEKEEQDEMISAATSEVEADNIFEEDNEVVDIDSIVKDHSKLQEFGEHVRESEIEVDYPVIGGILNSSSEKQENLQHRDVRSPPCLNEHHPNSQEVGISIGKLHPKNVTAQKDFQSENIKLTTFEGQKRDNIDGLQFTIKKEVTNENFSRQAVRNWSESGKDVQEYRETPSQTDERNKNKSCGREDVALNVDSIPKEMEDGYLKRIEEEREREREREKDRMDITRHALERPYTESRQRAFGKEMNVKAVNWAQEHVDRSYSDRFSGSREIRTHSSSNLSDHQNRQASNLRYSYTLAKAGIERESPQRCKARIERYQRTAERAAKALAEKSMRDLLFQREQVERNRLAEALDIELKRWSCGKEGNLRALLSTLQYILGSDSGWQAVSLTEIVTSAAVKKAYRKATLYVHPDKLQQRGASIQQKYICEKVFDLLKEAWTKFNSEER
ncbi:unnamed protein product [Cuscuta epithymum]|uniref:J domain-containing protein n=1 Tax=Cuscuta epithymum TaxID=186058 RepID=A0AAV0CZ52_9ASTE|nr:unnamed protein product [Cuscuta epithymum]